MGSVEGEKRVSHEAKHRRGASEGYAKHRPTRCGEMWARCGRDVGEMGIKSPNGEIRSRSRLAAVRPHERYSGWPLSQRLSCGFPAVRGCCATVHIGGRATGVAAARDPPVSVHGTVGRRYLRAVISCVTTAVST